VADTPLARRLSALIATGGPIPVADFMRACLFDPEHGYYTRAEPFGAAGDFITAPEISQMFGELLATWLHAAYVAQGAPAEAVLVEIGPGRGTMMADMRRTLGRLGSPLAAGSIVLVEASPRLAAVQQAALAGGPGHLTWCDGPDGLPDAPLYLVANELFDAIPIRQLERCDGAWHERLVTVADGSFAFALGPPLPGAGLPEAQEGTVIEPAPERIALMRALADRLARQGGAGLFVDYGEDGGSGDTLQAVRAHGVDGVFDHPGQADLTSQVDFAALSAAARTAGLATGLAEQGAFLAALGLAQRAARLAAGRDAETASRIAGEAARLADPQAMGRLFKVLAVAPAPLPLPPFGPG